MHGLLNDDIVTPWTDFKKRGGDDRSRGLGLELGLDGVVEKIVRLLGVGILWLLLEKNGGLLLLLGQNGLLDNMKLLRLVWGIVGVVMGMLGMGCVVEIMDLLWGLGLGLLLLLLLLEIIHGDFLWGE